MPVVLNPYLNFAGNTRAAMEFYRTVFGGELTLSTFGENQMPGASAAEAENIMHAELRAPNGILFMASDTPPGMNVSVGSTISMSLSGDDEPQLRSYFQQLSADGAVTMPLEPAPWGDTFGMCTDRFGVNWLVNILGTQAQ